MARTIKIAIIPVHEPRYTPTAADDQAIDEMFISNAWNEAVLQYWQQVSSGYMDIQATRLPWARLAANYAAADVVFTPWGPKITRDTMLPRFVSAARNLPGMAGQTQYHGLLFVPFPGRGPIVPDPTSPGRTVQSELEGGTIGNVKPTAILPAGMPEHSHSFHAHEVGHVLGLADSQGIWRWGGSSWDGGYGDPLDIMTAQDWFGGNPTRPGAPVPNWPNANAHLSMGPAPSLATLHFWDGSCLPHYAVREMHVFDDSTPSFRLNAAYGQDAASRLAVVHYGRPEDAPDPGGIRRMYLEFRDRSSSWDTGLDKPNSTRARTSVVAHVVQAVNGGSLQACYRGQIFVPVEVDSDLEVPGTPYTVRILQAGAGYVTVKITRSSPRGFKVESTTEQKSVQVNPHAIEVRVTPCGDRLRWGRWNTRTETAFLPTVWGYGGTGLDRFASDAAPLGGIAPPLPAASAVTLQWLVGGQPVPEVAGGTLGGCVAPEGVFSVDFAMDLRTRCLTLTSQYADRFKMPVQARLSDAALGMTATNHQTFESEGFYVGYPPADILKLARCGARMASELRIDPEIFRLPTGDGPRPNWHEHFQSVLGELRRSRPGSGAAIDDLQRLGELVRQLRLDL